MVYHYVLSIKKRIIKIFHLLFKIIFFSVFLISLSAAHNSESQDSLSIYYLKLKNLQKENALILAPDKFNETIDSFKKANKALNNNENSAYIIHLNEIKRNISKIEEIIKLSRDILDTAFANRQQAIRNNGKEHAKKRWNIGEDFLKKAISELNNKKYDQAKKYAAIAAENYKTAEIQALKQKYLSSATNAVNRAKRANADKWAPISFNEAIVFIKKANESIKTDPNNQSKIKKYALKAENEAIKAEYFSTIISAISNKPHNIEKLLLNENNRLLTYASLLNMKKDTFLQVSDLDTLVALEIEKITNERKMLFAENLSLENELTKIKMKIDSYQQKNKKEEDFKRKLTYIKTLFIDEKVDILITDKKIILKLYEIKFISNTSFIPPENFEILNKVVLAIYEFKDNPVVIIAHTDSRGSAIKNKNLTEKKAATVKEFLLQNLENYDCEIQTIAMGEDKPIASNATAKGRVFNRRIEVVIQLNKD